MTSPGATSEDALVARFHPLKLALLVLGSAGFVVCGAAIGYAAILGIEEMAASRSFAIIFPIFYFLISLICVAFFGFGLVYFLYRLVFFWRPALIVGPEDLYDAASALGAGRVRWEEVSRIGRITYGGQPYLAVRLKHEASFLARQPPIKRWLMHLNRKQFTGAPINIPTRFLTVSHEELLERASAYRKRQRSSKSIASSIDREEPSADL